MVSEFECCFVAAVAEWYRYRIVTCLVTSPVPLKTHRVGQRCTLNLSRAEMSSRWCVLSFSLDECRFLKAIWILGKWICSKLPSEGAIHQNDHQARRRFVEWAPNEIAVVPDFHKRILFSDEAHFWLNGYVNKQNCRIWSEANPQVYVETPLHPKKLTVWCALWAGGIIGPYFFKNDEGHNVTVNGDRYRDMINNFFIPELNNHDVQELWFQQDGTTCHTARATIDLLKDTLGDRLISRFGPVNWPPRSCDLTPLDYFLWGYVKSLVYADKPQALDHFEDNIRCVIADIWPQMLEKVIENWTPSIRASRGSPMPEIIFKM
ncbi:putative transposable element [Trichonephila clavipes]|nr:putative transposable element [Trichonephila clavipes]